MDSDMICSDREVFRRQSEIKGMDSVIYTFDKFE